MMMRKCYFILLSCLFLLSCNNQSTYDYLMLHPSELEKAYSACQVKDSPSCENIKRAAHDMGEFTYELATHPEQFGKNIMALQQSMSKQNETYHEQCMKLKIMYAILASQGP